MLSKNSSTIGENLNCADDLVTQDSVGEYSTTYSGEQVQTFHVYSTAVSKFNVPLNGFNFRYIGELTDKFSDHRKGGLVIFIRDAPVDVFE